MRGEILVLLGLLLPSYNLDFYCNLASILAISLEVLKKLGYYD